MSRSTEDLIRDLAGDLPPVRPMARVRVVVAMAIAVSLPFYMAWFGLRGLRHQWVAGEAPGVVYLLSAAVLLILAAGGLVFALTSVIPGREKDARAGQLVFGTGAGVVALLLLALGFTRETTLFEGLLSGRSCAEGALMLAVPAGIVVGRYVMRGAARNRPAALAVGFAGGAGLAAIAVHLTCAHPDPVHMVLGHAAVPLYGVVVLMALAGAYVGIARRTQYSGT